MLNTDTGCSEKLGSFHPWRLKTPLSLTWGTCSSWPCFEQGWAWTKRSPDVPPQPQRSGASVFQLLSENCKTWLPQFYQVWIYANFYLSFILAHYLLRPDSAWSWESFVYVSVSGLMCCTGSSRVQVCLGSVLRSHLLRGFTKHEVLQQSTIKGMSLPV